MFFDTHSPFILYFNLDFNPELIFNNMEMKIFLLANAVIMVKNHFDLL